MNLRAWVRPAVLACIAALLALAPVVASAEEPRPAPVPDPTKNTLGIEGTLTAVSPTSFTLRVGAAHEIEDATWRKIPRPEFVGLVVSVAIDGRTGITVGERSVPASTLAVGQKVGSVVAPDERPITLDRSFTALSVWIKSLVPGAPTPPPVRPAPPAEPGAPGAPAPGEEHRPGTGPGGPTPDVDQPTREDFRTPFFARNWRFVGEVLSTDVVGGRRVIDFDVTRLIGKGFGRERALLRESGVYLVVPARVVITDADGKRITFADLEADDTLAVVARMAKPGAWIDDEDGDPYPTAVAKRIKVVDAD